MAKFKIKATIPTASYGNIQPEYEVEALTFEEAESVAMPYIEKLWAKYCQQGAELATNQPVQVVEGVTEKMTSELTGVTLNYDKANHIYTNDKGEKYLGGSTFAKKYQHEFKKNEILDMMQKKYDIPKEEIAAMWAAKSEASSSFGTGIHAALELYGKFMTIGKATGKNDANKALHDQPTLKGIVEAFFKGREKEVALYEPMVADDKRMICGQIDRLLIVDQDKKICRIQDYKTNADVNKKGFNKTLLKPFEDLKDIPLSGYWLQLSFYAEVLKPYGWTVEGLDVFHWNGEKWETYSREPINLVEKGVLDG